ncbi:MAG: SDR family oxidoreductase [Deltaproteobacteria bacterium]|nr:SDR family oxidoreductase [Deltaproteobacteria bacterium]
MSEKKVVFITGASGLIGREILKTFHQNEYSVIAGYYQNQNFFEDLGIKEDVFPLKTDLAHEDSVKGAVQEIRSRYGRIEVLVNNAGMNLPNDFDQISIDDWNQVFDINLRGAFLLTRELHGVIKDGGAIVNIASFSAQVGGPRTTHYTAAKAGVIALTENMARFFAPRNIRVNCVSPGLIESEMAKAAKRLPILDNVLLNRLGKPEEIASVIFFLASEKASYINAQTISVNGGLSYSF